MDWISSKKSFVRVKYSGLLRVFCVALPVSSPTRLGKRGQACNILVLECIGCVEHNRIVMMVSKTMVKLMLTLT